VRVLAENIKPHDKIMLDRAWWDVVSMAPAEEGFVKLLVCRGAVRKRLSLAVGQEWTVHHPVYRKGTRGG